MGVQEADGRRRNPGGGPGVGRRVRGGRRQLPPAAPAYLYVDRPSSQSCPLAVCPAAVSSRVAGPSPFSPRERSEEQEVRAWRDGFTVYRSGGNNGGVLFFSGSRGSPDMESIWGKRAPTSSQRPRHTRALDQDLEARSGARRSRLASPPGCSLLTDGRLCLSTLL